MATEDNFSYLSSLSKKHRRARNWTDGEMKALLFVWEEHHNELKMSKRNAKVYEKMSQRFLELTGELRHKEEIKMKITNMSFQYRKRSDFSTDLKNFCRGSRYCQLPYAPVIILHKITNESGWVHDIGIVYKLIHDDCRFVFAMAGTEVPDWPYYKAIDNIMTKPMENGILSAFDFHTAIGGPSTSSIKSSENLLAQAGAGGASGGGGGGGGGGLMGFMPEYTGSSDEMEMKQEVIDSLSSDSIQSLDSSARPGSGKRKRVDMKLVSMKRKKLRVLRAMLQEQRRLSRSVEEGTREVRQALQQQNFLQIQTLQLQERMMNLLEKMVTPPHAGPSSAPWGQGRGPDPGQP